ncbi:MAG: hypothetical protein JNL41_03260 [Phenylobacterium sp.]|uniref:hypothetical protein n=1 Tax=Phenylobacterium sp. TaxID=1871053 RepID=UPI001A445094|nr:hypothetical protein [Phenylobacterium sp.]MBL8553272.1 hypothetical protein [Phenylobacterium sp.]
MDALMSLMAEGCASAFEAARARMEAAEDSADFERCGRIANAFCGRVGAILLLKQRFDREQAALAEGARQRAETAAGLASVARAAAVKARGSEVRTHFIGFAFDTFPREEAHEVLAWVRDWVREHAADDDFVDAPIETVIQRVIDDLDLPPHGDLGYEDEEPEFEPVEAASPAPRPLRAPPRAAIAEAPAPEPVAVAAEPPPPAPPPHPPDPPPERGYIPPWELLKPGQIFPGSSGW